MQQVILHIEILPCKTDAFGNQAEMNASLHSIANDWRSISYVSPMRVLNWCAPNRHLQKRKCKFYGRITYASATASFAFNLAIGI